MLSRDELAARVALELVDGQQRLTTISILLECIRQRLEELGEADQAADLARLITAKALGGKAMRKVCLDSLDAEEFELLLKRRIEFGHHGRWYGTR